MGLSSPISTTNLAYFGNATIGSNSLFKIQALAAVTFNGTRIWTTDSRQYSLVGPVTYEIDTTLGALGSHLVLEFNTASSLVLDATENPLSYWGALNHSNTVYAIVIGEVREQELLLYPAIGERPATLLTYGHLEAIEMTRGIGEWIYSLPYKVDLVPSYEVVGGMGSGTTFAMKEVGSLRGIQAIVFTPSVQRQLALRRLLPYRGWFLFQTNDITASSSRIQSLASLTNSIVTFDKLNGDLL